MSKNVSKSYSGGEEISANPIKSALLEDFLFLLLKIAIMLIVALVAFIYVFGAFKCSDISMAPGIKAGDLVLYYRLDKKYAVGDLTVVDRDGSLQVRRIVATGGDTVDINEEGLLINGDIQTEKYIYEATRTYNEGVEFPVTLADDEIFVLGDLRDNASDSRIYGAIKAKDTKGMVSLVLKRQDL